MTASVVMLLCLLIGVVCGLRSMTGPALVCWGAHLGWLALAGSAMGWMTHPVSLIVFSVFAVGEIVADKLPKTPNRTSPGPLIARIVFGAICGAALAIAGHVSLGFGVAAGPIGALIGAFGGFQVRRALTSGGRIPDLPVALLEDLIAVGGGLLVVSRF
jgi:uncharacterized membrane protein